mmetsp:Transcript_8135/g.22029  ORF Transcript_8135/g.22029 Transcript_8135/m.22029 type:complete len:132 (+) Transcript_8135:120-515(+)
MELELETCVPRKHRREDAEEGREGPGDAAKRMKVDGSIPGARTTLPRSVSIPLLPVLCPAPTMLPMAPSTPPYHPLSIVPWAPRPAYLAPTTTSRSIDSAGIARGGGGGGTDSDIGIGIDIGNDVEEMHVE